MFKIKRIFLCFLLGTVFSCGQDPLKGFPADIRDGVLKTGLQHFSNFSEVLVEKLIKIDVVGKNDLTMEFYEGVAQSYNIKFRMLNHFNSKYELIIKDNPFAELKGSQWSYDSKKQIGVLKWRPSETFTWDQTYVKVSLPLSIQLKKLGYPDKGSISTVNREFTAVVHKSYTPPKFYRIKMDHDSYINLSDDRWYRDHLLSSLDLGFYGKLYAGEKLRSRVEDNFIFYTLDVYMNLHSMSDYSDPEWDAMSEGKNENAEWDAIGLGRDFDILDLTDELGESVPIELVPFLKEPYYQVINKITAGESCITEKTDFLNRSLCLAPLTELGSVALSAELYVKHYNIPPHIQRNHLYYKIDSQALCGIYHKISSDFMIHQQKKWNLQKNCYLSLDKLNAKNVPTLDKTLDRLKLKNIPITEKTDIYIFKGDSSFERVDKSKWELSFYKLPEHVKWRLGGHQPVSSPILPVNLMRAGAMSALKFYLKDHNYSEPPYFIFEERENQILPQNIPIKWTLQGVGKTGGDKWERFYGVELMDWLEKEKYTKLYDFPFNLKPVSAGIVGKSVRLEFNILPSVKVNYIESFNPDENFKISTHIKQSDGIQEWVGVDVSIETQMREEYVFSSNFKENIAKALPFANESKSLRDLLAVKNHNPKSSHACFMDRDGPFKESACECSEFVFYERALSDEAKEEESGEMRGESDDKQQENKPVYMESICSYKAKLELNSAQTNKDNQIISAYWKWDYSVDTLVVLKNLSADGEGYSGQALSVDKEYVNEYPLANEPAEENSEKGFGLHIFFNLKPEINCFVELDSSHKTCQIRYRMDKTPDFFDLTQFNKDKYFFSEQGVEADIACLTRDSTKINSDFEKASEIAEDLFEIIETSDSCVCEVPQFITENKQVGKAYDGQSDWSHVVKDRVSFLEVKCSVGKHQKGSVELALKTNSPYIYFLDPEMEDDIKSTTFKSLKIE
ncbi:MAG: hypothetical protein OXJ52_07055 [Oligoflexia bacterium]|nr:hypothetical protein [Oligoflexia bacterium]